MKISEKILTGSEARTRFYQNVSHIMVWSAIRKKTKKGAPLLIFTFYEEYSENKAQSYI
jgi:hypothetical protein